MMIELSNLHIEVIARICYMNVTVLHKEKPLKVFIIISLLFTDMMQVLGFFFHENVKNFIALLQIRWCNTTTEKFTDEVQQLQPGFHIIEKWGSQHVWLHQGPRRRRSRFICCFYSELLPAGALKSPISWLMEVDHAKSKENMKKRTTNIDYRERRRHKH